MNMFRAGKHRIWLRLITFTLITALVCQNVASEARAKENSCLAPGTKVGGVARIIGKAIALKAGSQGGKQEVKEQKGIMRLYSMLMSFIKAKTHESITAIADIHGNMDWLREILIKVVSKSDKIVFLGDYIDRGKNSIEVVEKVKKLTEEGIAIPLMGNHEMMFIMAMMGDKAQFLSWILNGADTVLNEVGVAEGDPEIEETITYFALLAKALGYKNAYEYIETYHDEDIEFLHGIVMQNAKLIEMADWMKENLDLYHIGENGALYMHAFMPMDEDGKIVLFHESDGVIYRNLKALAKLEEEMKDAFDKNDISAKALLHLSGQLFLKQSPLWVKKAQDDYGKLTDTDVSDVIERVGADKVLEQIGVSMLITGHVADNSLVNIENRIFRIDRNILGGRGCSLRTSPEGIGYDSYFAPTSEQLLVPKGDYDTIVEEGRNRAKALAEEIRKEGIRIRKEDVIGRGEKTDKKKIELERFVAIIAGNNIFKIVMYEEDIYINCRNINKGTLDLGHRIELGKEFKVGRSNDNDYVIDDETLSPEHFAIKIRRRYADKYRLEIRDLGSLSKTKVIYHDIFYPEEEKESPDEVSAQAPTELSDISGIEYEGETDLSMFFTGRGNKDGKRYWIKVAKEPLRNKYSDNELEAIRKIGDDSIAKAIFAGTVQKGDTLYKKGAPVRCRYIVFEEMDGEDLESIIPEGGLREDRILRIARKIAGLMKIIQDKGVIHRDLRSGNIRIGPDDSVKIYDFNISLHDKSHEDIKKAGLYCSENWANKWDKQVDIFAFGLLLVHMFTGEEIEPKDYPFYRTDEIENTGIKAIAKRCLDERGPGKRYEDFSKVIRALDEIMGNTPEGAENADNPIDCSA